MPRIHEGTRTPPLRVKCDVTPAKIAGAARDRIWSMKRDRRSATEQIKSGFLIVAKILAAFGIAVTFMAGCVLIWRPGNWHQIAVGWLLTAASIALMITTVRFWAGGFFGFIAYGAWRSLGGVLVADAYHASRLYMVIVSASIFAMAVLSHRFAAKQLHITTIDRATIVIAATCVLVTFLLGDTYKGMVVFNLGNLALLLSWWVARTSRRNRHKSHTAPVLTA